MSIGENVQSIRARIAAAAAAAGREPSEIRLVAASKTKDADSVRQAIAAGVDACGENRVQELLEKNALGAYAGAKLHFIGKLQQNKVKKVVGLCDLIESVDSIELLRRISARAETLGVVQDVLLEINIAGEESKSGMEPNELPATFAAASELGGVRVRGLMAIPPISDVKGQNRAYFRSMFKLFIDNSGKKYDNVSMEFLSMGMSGDFEDAVSEGANMVRVGSAIFGERG